MGKSRKYLANVGCTFGKRQPIQTKEFKKIIPITAFWTFESEFHISFILKSFENIVYLKRYILYVISSNILDFEYH